MTRYSDVTPYTQHKGRHRTQHSVIYSHIVDEHTYTSVIPSHTYTSVIPSHTYKNRKFRRHSTTHSYSIRAYSQMIDKHNYTRGHSSHTQTGNVEDISLHTHRA